MNKADMAELISQKFGQSKSSAEDMIEMVFETITNEIKESRQVSIAGFGIFSVKDRAARKARNPRTGETVDVPPFRAPKFRPSKQLKDKVNQ